MRKSDYKKRMRRNRILTVILISSVIVVGVLFVIYKAQIRKEMVLQKKLAFEEKEDEIEKYQQEKKRKQMVDEIESQINRKQRELQTIIIVVNNIDRSLYDIIYPQMKKFGYKGVFVLMDGKVPGENANDISWEEYQEMLNDGWEYAVGISQDTRDVSLWNQELNNAIECWKEKGIVQPSVYFDEIEGNQIRLYDDLKRCGFTSIIENNNSETCLVKENTENILVIKSLNLKEKYSGVSKTMRNVCSTGKSLSISLPCIRDEINDENEELSVSKLEIFLGQLTEMEQYGYNIRTDKEYIQICEKTKREVEELENQKKKIEAGEENNEE